MSTKTNEVAKKFVQIPLGHEILVKFPKYTLGSFSCIHSLIFKKKYDMANQTYILFTKGMEHNWFSKVPLNSCELHTEHD